MRPAGGCPGLRMRDWVPIEVSDWGNAGYWSRPRLAGSPAVFEGLGWTMVLSKRAGDLIIATCGLGGPQYGEEQTAKQPAMLGGTFRGRWVVGAFNG